MILGVPVRVSKQISSPIPTTFSLSSFSLSDSLLVSSPRRLSMRDNSCSTEAEKLKLNKTRIKVKNKVKKYNCILINSLKSNKAIGINLIQMVKFFNTKLLGICLCRHHKKKEEKNSIT